MADKASTIGKAYVQILPSTEGIASQMTAQLGGEVQSAGDKAGTLMGGAMSGSLLSALSGIGSRIADVMKTAAGAALKAGEEFLNSAADTAAYGDSIDKLSQKMGLSAESYQEWDAVMQHSGASMEAMKASMKTLATAAEKGNAAFAQIGITQEELKKMSQEELFDATIKGLQELDDVTERTYLSGQLLGRGATELGALLNTSAEDTQKMRDRIHELGGVMSNEAVKASAQFEDNMQDLRTAMSGAKNTLMSEFLPGINTLTEGFTKLIAGEEGAEETLVKGIRQITEKVGNIAEKLFDDILAKANVIIPDVLNVIVTLSDSIMTGLAAALPQFAEGIAALIPQLVTAFGVIGDALIQTLPILIDAAVTLIGELAAALPDILPAVAEAILGALPPLIEGITDVLPLLIDTVIQVVDRIAALLPEILPELFTAVVNAIPLLAQAVAENLPAVIQTLTDVVNSVAKVIPDILPVLMPALTDGLCALVEGLAAAAEALPELVGAVIDISMAIIDTILDNQELFLDCGVKVMKAMGKALINHFPEFTESLGKLFVKIVDVLKGWFPKLLNTGKKLWAHIADGFSEGWDGFVSDMTEWGDSVIEACEDIGEEMADFWGGLWNDMVTLGGNLVKGIVQGLVDGWNECIDKISEFGDTVVETVCDIFDINSPSKVMEEQVGKYLALGIGTGFDKEIGDVSRMIGGEVSSMMTDITGTGSLEVIAGGSYEQALSTAPVADTAAGYTAPSGNDPTPAPTVLQFVINGRTFAEATVGDFNDLLGTQTVFDMGGYAR